MNSPPTIADKVIPAVPVSIPAFKRQLTIAEHQLLEQQYVEEKLLKSIQKNRNVLYDWSKQNYHDVGNDGPYDDLLVRAGKFFQKPVITSQAPRRKPTRTKTKGDNGQFIRRDRQGGLA